MDNLQLNPQYANYINAKISNKVRLFLQIQSKNLDVFLKYEKSTVEPPILKLNKCNNKQQSR